jgi:bifunctional UDP-N-acetylglucosamine pyrophosphorylase/glucosamine-1-phosphate N-acetyltransferase
VRRALVIPAAGSGSRLGAAVPKLLLPVNGRPMVLRLLDLYAQVVDSGVIVVSPTAVKAASEVVASSGLPVAVTVQTEPTGMLDAILLARAELRQARPDRVLITWCDQVAISPETVAAVVAAAAAKPEPDLVLPSCRRSEPYVHLERDAAGRIVRVLHRREGDDMPAFGETDAGVFELSAEAFFEWLAEYAEAPEIGARTGERNFVPFVARAAGRGQVVTVPCREQEESIGINTPEELALLEQHLRARTGR